MTKNNIMRRSRTVNIEHIKQFELVSMDNDKWELEINMECGCVYTKPMSLKEAAGAYISLYNSIKKCEDLISICDLEETKITDEGKNVIDELITIWSKE